MAFASTLSALPGPGRPGSMQSALPPTAEATDAQPDAAAIRVLVAADCAATRVLAWNTPLLPFGLVLQALAR